ncbi:MAG: hypothetical protein IPK82_23280 [Polyangiaceae bacterium]|nr:hypothetical protein [Polyangiaceae bacterium]
MFGKLKKIGGRRVFIREPDPSEPKPEPKPKAAPKKRGRPAKSKAPKASTSKAKPSRSKAAPKKRGRPAKSKAPKASTSKAKPSHAKPEPHTHPSKAPAHRITAGGVLRALNSKNGAATRAELLRQIDKDQLDDALSDLKARGLIHTEGERVTVLTYG